MAQEAQLEQKALDELRRGDLRAAHATLVVLSSYRPNDAALRRRIQQVEDLIRQREEAQARIQAEPLRYAHAYIQAGRLGEGLQLLRAALSRDPNNQRLRDLALEVARRLREQVQARSPSDAAVVPPTPAADGPLREAQHRRETETQARREAEARAREDADRREVEVRRRRETAERTRRQEETERLRLEAEARAHYEAQLEAKRTRAPCERAESVSSKRRRRLHRLEGLLARVEQRRRSSGSTSSPVL